MAIYTTEVLVLGVKNWGNADKIVTLLSPTYGKITAAAYGCRRPKSPLAASMQPFSWLDIQLSKGEKMDTVRQCEHKGFFSDLYEDLTAMAYASFIAELAKELCSEDEPQAEIYEKLLKILPCLTKFNPRICALASAYQILVLNILAVNFIIVSVRYVEIKSKVIVILMPCKVEQSAHLVVKESR